MIGKKINQLATELAPASTDLTIIGNPTTGVSKKITLAQLGAIFSGAVSFYTNYAAFPTPGTTDVIYCAKDTKKLYLWSGSAYVEVFPSQALLDTYQLRSEKGNANGYASLDSQGKVPISQLPSSIMEYKGTWSAATNTPTLANGTGDTGDVYICNAAGSVNFGAGSITFAVGDYVIYSGSIWQRSSGAVGTVTSVAASITGDAIGITGSPVTTSGTLAFAFSGTTSQYIRGNGTLANFPTNLVSGTGTTNYVTKWSSTSGEIINSGIVDIGGSIYNALTTAGQFAWQFNGSTTTGMSYGALINAGTNASDIALRIQNASSTSVYFYVWGDGKVQINNIPNATTDTDKFLVSDSGVIKYRTGAELLSDIGGQPSGNYVTSVAVSRSGDALAITGSPITSSGTINIGFAGNSTQYINGAGNLVTFPGVINEAQNLITEVYNKTGATLTKGTVVYINGGQGNLPTITKALATGDATSAQTYGIVRNDITNNNNGYVVVAGRISDLDTQAYTEGTQLYLSSTTAGTYTSTKQYAPAHLVYVGIVVRAHPTQGVIEVKIQNGYEMDELHNVSTQSPSNGDIIQYVTSTSLWTKVAGTTSNIAEGSNLYYTEARVNANTNVAANTAARHNAVTIGTANGLSLSTQVLSLALASGSTTGALSSTDWTTFNGKQAALNGTGFVKISGTTISYDNSTYLTTSAASSTYLPLAGGTLTGALGGTSATFSSSVNIGTNLASGTALAISNTTNARQFQFGYSTGAGYNYFQVYDGTSFQSLVLNNALTLASTGAATFSSSVTASAGYFNSNIIIGSGAASYALDIYGSAGVGMEIFETSTGTNKRLRITQDSGNVSYDATYSSGGNGHIFKTGGGAALTIANGGNVGIGTTSPSTLFYVNGYTASNWITTLNNTGTSGHQMYFGYNDGSTTRYGLYIAGGQGSGASNFDLAVANKFYVMSNGNVGIGTTSPSYLLDIQSSSATLRIKNTTAPATGGTSSLLFEGINNYSGTSQSFINSIQAGNSGATQLVFGTSGTIDATATERMRITSGGNVGVGTSSPAKTLDVFGSNGNATAQIKVKSTGNTSAGYFGTFANSLYISAGGSYDSGWSTDGTNGIANIVMETSNGGSAIAFGTAGSNSSASERMRITSGGDVCINATSTIASAKLYVNGIGAFGGVYVGSLGTGLVYSNGGTLTSTNPSDQRLKNTIKPLSYGLNEILQLNPKTFYYNDDVNKDRLKYGFIAQEVQGIMPELARKLNAETDYLGLETEGIYVTLVNAIKEQQNQINELKSQLNK